MGWRIYEIDFDFSDTVLVCVNYVEYKLSTYLVRASVELAGQFLSPRSMVVESPVAKSFLGHLTIIFL